MIANSCSSTDRHVAGTTDGTATDNSARFSEFEDAIARLLGVKHCIAMCNGTVAMEIAIRALNLNGEVIVPSFTFIATPHALRWQGLTPVFCDINPDTHTLDPDRVEECITPSTTGIVGVHLWGRACDIEALSRIAEKHNLIVLEDSAHTIGSELDGRKLGAWGAIGCFSFFSNVVRRYRIVDLSPGFVDCN